MPGAPPISMFSFEITKTHMRMVVAGQETQAGRKVGTQVPVAKFSLKITKDAYANGSGWATLRRRQEAHQAGGGPVGRWCRRHARRSPL